MQTQQLLPISVILPLLNPKYPPEYLQKFNQLKIIIKNQQFTENANKLAEQVLFYSESNYNCWYVKKQCFLKGVISLEHELQFSQHTLFQKIKNFQIWQHRRFLTEHSKLFKEEYQLINKILKLQSKNYHAWSYRIWIVNQVQNYHDQIQFTHQMINQDPYNNSVWSYRQHIFYQILNKQTNQQEKLKMLHVQITQTLIYIENYLNNEASWNYLRGFFPSIQLNNIPSQNIKNKPLAQYKKFPQILEFVKFEMDKLQKKFNNKDFKPKLYYFQAEVQLLITLVCIESGNHETLLFAKNTCLLLAEKEKQKRYYWKWVAANLNGKISSKEESNSQINQ